MTPPISKRMTPFRFHEPPRSVVADVANGKHRASGYRNPSEFAAPEERDRTLSADQKGPAPTVSAGHGHERCLVEAAYQDLLSTVQGRGNGDEAAIR